MSNCGCKNRVSGYVDVSRIEPVDWDDIPVLLGITPCGEVKPVEKPNYSIITEEEKEKLAHIIIDGGGDEFLAKDGNYKTIDSIWSIELDWSTSSSNFAIINQTKLQSLVNYLQNHKETFVAIIFNNERIHINAHINSNRLILEYNMQVLEVTSGEITGRYNDKFNVILDISSTPYNVITYDYIRKLDADFSIDNISNDLYELVDRVTNIEDNYLKLSGGIMRGDINMSTNAILFGSDAYIDGNDSNITVHSGDNHEGNIIMNCNGGTFNVNSDFTIMGGDTGRITYSALSVTANSTPLILSGSGINLTTNYQGTKVNYNGVEVATVNDISDLEDKVSTNTQSISDLQTSTEAAFNVVNNQIDNLDERIEENSTNISVNATNIEQIRNDLNNQQRLRGYFETTTDITEIPNPSLGDYAYNAETGTIWAYNGSTWYNTTEPIPSGAIQAYDAVPLINGIGDSGSSNRFSRGDHVHPTDITRAAASDLDNYLLLSGNTQTTRITGNIWISSGQRINISNSGNSYITQNSTTSTSEFIGNGVGGIDLITENGTVKSNGNEVVVYNSNDDLEAKNNIILGNDCKLLGTGSDGVQHNLIEKSRFGIIDAGSQLVHFNISSSDRPTVQLEGESGLESYEIAFINDLTTTTSSLQEQITKNSENIADNTTNIAINKSDIESIQELLANTENFRGYYATTAQINSIQNPVNGNYAFNAETGTVWAYNGITWYNTGDEIPDQTVEAYDGLPLIDGTASSGLVNQFSRGDHRHPTDTSRASQSDLINTDNRLNQLGENLTLYQSYNEQRVSQIQESVSTNTSNISLLVPRVSSIESDLSTLQTQAIEIGNNVNDLETGLSDANSRIDINAADIASLQSEVTNSEHFRGAYLTTVEITTIPATNGDFAWNYETGTVWIYDGDVPSWTDSGTPLISGSSIVPSDTLPLIDGTASAGLSETYSRSDHRHPTDTTRAAAEDIPTSLSDLTNDTGFITNSALANYVTSSDLTSQLSSYATVSTVNNLTTRVTTTETNITSLEEKTKYVVLSQIDYENLPDKDADTFYYTY